jgi:hypothetical protein
MIQTDADRRVEYETCQKRGHQRSGYVLSSVPPKDVCKWCGTAYWYTTELHESQVPPGALVESAPDRIETVGP